MLEMLTDRNNRAGLLYYSRRFYFHTTWKQCTTLQCFEIHQFGTYGSIKRYFGHFERQLNQRRVRVIGPIPIPPPVVVVVVVVWAPVVVGGGLVVLVEFAAARITSAAFSLIM